MPTTIETLHDHVESALPQYGPYSSEHTQTAASLASELVRYLNHATNDTRDAVQALPYPAITSSVIASAKVLTQRLEQLLGQLADREDQHAADPELRSYGRNTPPAIIAGTVAEDLRAAAQAVGQATELLERAHNGAARLSV